MKRFIGLWSNYPSLDSEVRGSLIIVTLGWALLILSWVGLVFLLVTT